MEALKKTLRAEAKKILTKFDAPFTLAVVYDKKVIALSVTNAEDIQYFITQKNDVASVNFAFDALSHKGVNAVIVLETGDDSQEKVECCSDEFAEQFGGSVAAFLPSDKAAVSFLHKRGAVMLDTVGVATTGRSIEEALCSLEILLKAKLAMKYGTPQPLSKKEVNSLHLRYKRESAKNQKMLYDFETLGKCPSPSSAVGVESLAEILVYAKKMEIEELSQGVWRSVSIRHGDSFFITPQTKSNIFLTENDIVKVNTENGFYKTGKKPSRDIKLHQAIYKDRGDVGAVIHCHPIYSSVNAELDVGLEVSQKMQRIFGERIEVSEYAGQGTERLGKRAVESLKGGVAVFLSKQGLTVVGKTLVDAYWTLNAIEDESLKSFKAKEELWQRRT